jgi:hypothetical protein
VSFSLSHLSLDFFSYFPSLPSMFYIPFPFCSFFFLLPFLSIFLLFFCQPSSCFLSLFVSLVLSVCLSFSFFFHLLLFFPSLSRSLFLLMFFCWFVLSSYFFLHSSCFLSLFASFIFSFYLFCLYLFPLSVFSWPPLSDSPLQLLLARSRNTNTQSVMWTCSVLLATYTTRTAHKAGGVGLIDSLRLSHYVLTFNFKYVSRV